VVHTSLGLLLRNPAQELIIAHYMVTHIFFVTSTVEIVEIVVHTQFQIASRGVFATIREVARANAVGI